MWTRNSTLTVFVLPGETGEAWSELVEVQTLRHRHRWTTAQLGATTEALMRADCPDVYWRTLKQTHDELFYEWRHNGCKGVAPQHTLNRSLRGGDAHYGLHYTAMVPKLSAEQRRRWLAILEAARLRPRGNHGDGAFEEG